MNLSERGKQSLEVVIASIESGKVNQSGNYGITDEAGAWHCCAVGALLPSPVLGSLGKQKLDTTPVEHPDFLETMRVLLGQELTAFTGLTRDELVRLQTLSDWAFLDWEEQRAAMRSAFIAFLKEWIATGRPPELSQVSNLLEWHQRRQTKSAVIAAPVEA